MLHVYMDLNEGGAILPDGEGVSVPDLATARMLAAGTFEGFDFPLVFAAYDDTASNGFLIDFYANNSGGGSVTDFAGGYQDGYDGISLTASVPEPASWALMLAGFAMVAGATRYRRRAPRVAYS